MRVLRSPEASKELQGLSELDEMLAAGAEACIEMLGFDADAISPESEAGFSIQPVLELKRRRIHVFRVRYDEYLPGLRILYFRLRGDVFITGIHKREDLYDSWKEPMLRAQRYWGRRDSL